MILLDIALPNGCMTCPMHQYGLNDHWCAADDEITWETADDVPSSQRDQRCSILGEVGNKCGNGHVDTGDQGVKEYDVYNVWRL